MKKYFWLRGTQYFVFVPQTLQSCLAAPSDRKITQRLSQLLGRRPSINCQNAPVVLASCPHFSFVASSKIMRRTSAISDPFSKMPRYARTYFYISFHSIPETFILLNESSSTFKIFAARHFAEHCVCTMAALF